jgi:hypothetical protein
MQGWPASVPSPYHESRTETTERATATARVSFFKKTARVSASHHFWTRVRTAQRSFLPVCVHVFLTGRATLRQHDSIVDLQ